MKMDIVVERIAANGQPDRKGAETCRAVRIRNDPDVTIDLCRWYSRLDIRVRITERK